MIIFGLAVAWLLQLFLSYLQLRRFYGQVSQLRKTGNLVSIGMAGSAWKGRQYAILAVDPDNDIIRQTEQLSGWTVLASLKPLHGLEGMTWQDLLNEETPLPKHIHHKLALALRDAAKHIEEHKKRKKEVLPEQYDPSNSTESVSTLF
jgi:DNA-binding transcriptional regulator of glucitol operon